MKATRSPSCLPPRDRTGFTLVELLVVLAILAMMVGLILPALAKSMNASRAVVCGSNIRQVSVAASAYCADNKDYFVPGAYNALANLSRWHGERTSTHQAFDSTRGRLASYLGPAGRIKKCPEFNEYRDDQPGQWSGTFEAGCGGYGYNSTYIGGRSDQFYNPEDSKQTARISEINKPCETLLFADSAVWNRDPSGRFLIEYSFLSPPWFVTPAGLQFTWGRPTPSMHFRHDGHTAVVAWADNHVDRRVIQWSATSIYLTSSSAADLYQLDSGWFGPQGSNELFDRF